MTTSIEESFSEHYHHCKAVIERNKEEKSSLKGIMYLLIDDVTRTGRLTTEEYCKLSYQLLEVALDGIDQDDQD